MNLYIRKLPNKMWSQLLDVEGKIVGTIRPDVADWLVKKGVAIDITNGGA